MTIYGENIGVYNQPSYVYNSVKYCKYTHLYTFDPAKHRCKITFLHIQIDINSAIL